MNEIRQQGYYVEPRFHASIAWALLSPPSVAPEDTETGDKAERFASILAFPEDLVEELERTYGRILREVGGIDVENISVKIAKDSRTFRLAGPS